MTYSFYDTDIFNTCNEEYDISGDDYLELLKLCEKYCCYFSLLFGEDSKYIELFKPFRLPYDDMLRNVSYCMDCIPMYFPITEETIKLLMSVSDSIFGFPYKHKTTADLTFYRRDKTIFLSSTTHDGVCTLTPIENENVENIISNELWIKED